MNKIFVVILLLPLNGFAKEVEWLYESSNILKDGIFSSFSVVTAPDKKLGTACLRKLDRKEMILWCQKVITSGPLLKDKCFNFSCEKMVHTSTLKLEDCTFRGSQPTRDRYNLAHNVFQASSTQGQTLASLRNKSTADKKKLDKKKPELCEKGDQNDCQELYRLAEKNTSPKKMHHYRNQMCKILQIEAQACTTLDKILVNYQLISKERWYGDLPDMTIKSRKP